MFRVFNNVGDHIAAYTRQAAAERAATKRASQLHGARHVVVDASGAVVFETKGKTNVSDLYRYHNAG